jgi:uncharacterized protein YqeY
MKILTQLEERKTLAMKTGDKPTLSVVRMLIDAIQKKEKSLQREATQDEVISVVQLFKKQIDEEAEGFAKVGNQDKVEQLEQDSNLVKFYLPEQLTREELTSIVKTTIDSLSGGHRNIGTVMKLVNPLVKGKADGRVVNEIVKKEFEQV